MQSKVLGIENFSVDSIASIIANTPHKRSSVFLSLVTLKAFIFQVLSDGDSCRQAVAGVLVDRIVEGQFANTINTGPYTKARQRLPLQELKKAATDTGLRLHNQTLAAWRWKSFRVVLTDGATVQMPDTTENQADFPQLKSQKPDLGFPIARMVVSISLAAGTVIDYNLCAYQGM